MEQTPSNAPIMEPARGPAGWPQIWIQALTKPGEQTFINIVENPEATTRTAFIWVFIAGTISMIIQAVLGAIYTAMGIAPQLPIPGLEQYMQQPAGGGNIGSAITSLITGICASPIAGLVSILFFAIGVAIVQWIAKLFGGSGNFEKLAYAFAAITVPFTLVSMIFSLFSAVPYLNICTGVVSWGISLYALYQQIAAVKAVNRFGWGQAAGATLLPAIVIITTCCCLVFGLSAVLGPAISEVFNQINQSLAP